jgi:hypothetical protein
MNRIWMQALLVVSLILMAMAWQAAAEPRALGDWCWRLVPYQNTVLLRVYTGETLDGEPHVPLTYNFWMLGLDIYSFSGGGTGTLNYSGGLLTLQAVAHMTHDTAFGGNPVLEFKAVIALDTFAGRTSIRAEGAPRPFAIAYEDKTGMQWIDCAEHGQRSSPQLSVAQEQEWRVLGFK